MITWTYVEPLRNNMSIEAFEAHHNITLPMVYKAFARQYNNGYPSPNTFSLPNGDSCEVSHLYSFNREDAENIWDFNRPDNLSAGYVAFATDDFGNQLCFRLSDQAVIFADLDTNQLFEVAPDFSAFLTSLT